MFRSLCCCGNNTEVIRKIELSHSLLQEIPSDVFLSERTLEKLYLDANHISELPRQLFNCDELRTLNLSDNEISFLPPAISSLINLQKLDISKNAVSTLPDNIRSCTNLSVLDLSVNPLEKFPESLVNLISLHELYLTDVYLEFLPANFGKLVNLRILELRENNLVTLPKTMSRLVHLTRLDIGNNEFSELPEIVSSLTNLTELWIDGNHIRKLSPSIGHLRKMIHFEASNNNIEYLPRDIGYWTRVVEFSVSNNDLGNLPTTIGNMKNLVGLRLDENSLKNLPDTLGKLTNLEELMLSRNYLTHLPTSIGLLRKLHVLTVDKNYLSDIPSELGSCTSLSILSLRGNRITEVPAEIGHLSGLRVLNLVDNHLRFLPMSLLKLTKLSALWLSNNQSQPLVPLQQEFQPEIYQMVLTCFMLPQLSHKRTTAEPPKEEPTVTPRHTHHRHICFASDAGITIEQPGRLTRAPTPYPKELRALAKHAKNVQRGLTVSQYRQGEKVVTPIQGPVQIKEAKVTITPQNSCPEVETPSTCFEHNVYPQPGIDDGVEQSVTSEEIFQDTTKKVSDACVMSQPVLAFDRSPVIREAKNIRTDLQNQPIAQSPLSTVVLQKNEIKQTSTPQPPPYHIAAAYSLHAQFFNSLDGPVPESSTNSACSQVPNSPTLSTLERHERANNLNETYSISHSENNDNDNIPAMRDNENNLNKTTNDLSHISNNELNQTEYKPRTFIQDKPSPGQNIVAPTPKRPNGSDKATKIPHLSGSPSMKRSPGLARTIPTMHAERTTSNLPQMRCSPRTYRRDSIRSARSEISIQASPVMAKRELMRPNNSDVPVHAMNIDKNMNTKGRSKIPAPKMQVADNTTKWVFGQHKNAKVEQVTVLKNPDLGFTLSQNFGKGIFVESVQTCPHLRAGDKILEVEGVDISRMSRDEAMVILNACGPTINMMVSHLN